MDSRTPFSNASGFSRPGFGISRKAWYWIIGVVLTVAVLLIWAVIASAQWLLYQGKDAAVDMINGAPKISETVLGKVEQVMPGAKKTLEGAIPEAKEALEGVVPGATGAIESVLGGLDLNRSAQREVSGNDVAPVVRYSGLVRIAWDKAGVAQYEGKADFKQVRHHYSTGFIEQGFTESIISANQGTEVQEYLKGQDRYKLTTTQKSPSIVQLKIEKMMVQSS
nr:hypothetical protein [uncultured Undibacterium sp.]